MTYEAVMDLARETELPFAYDHFAEGESPDPPFLCFLYPENVPIGADDTVYYQLHHLDIELYTDRKMPDIEAQIEAVFDRHGLYYDKSEVWIPEEKLYEVLYSTEVIYEQEQDQVQP